MFTSLDTELLKELIPKVGQRIIFKREVDKLAAGPSTSKSSQSTRNNLSISDSDDIIIPFSPASTSSTITNATPYTFSATSSDVEDLPPEAESQIKGDDTNVPLPLENSASGSAQNNVYILNVDTVTEATTNSENKITTSAQMKDLFMATNTGKGILEVYNQSTFQRAHRQTIADLVIRNELEGNPNKKVSGERLNELAEMIVTLFPTEYKEIYFSKEKILKNGKTETLAKGKLVSKFYSLRRSFRQCGLLPKLEGQNSPSDGTAVDEDNHEDLILWLQNSTEPWNTVQDTWAKTSKIRTKQLLKPGNLVEYFESYPCLRLETGYLLLEIDFNISFPDYGMNLFNFWESVSNKIIEHARSGIHTKDSAIKNLLEDLTADISSDVRTSIVLLLITHILPTISIRKGKQSARWRPSRLEVAEGFWLRLKNISELAQAVENKKNKLQKLGLSIQPFVIVIGPSRTDIQTVYVKIDQHLYPMPSCLKALDICFKSFHALHAEYAKESEQVWTFIQHAIYKLHTKWDKSFTGVNSLLADLNV